MKRMSCGIAIGIVCLVGAALSAQAPAGGAQQPPQRFTNLQVWPKDTSPPQPMIAWGRPLAGAWFSMAASNDPLTSPVAGSHSTS